MPGIQAQQKKTSRFNYWPLIPPPPAHPLISPVPSTLGAHPSHHGQIQKQSPGARFSGQRHLGLKTALQQLFGTHALLLKDNAIRSKTVLVCTRRLGSVNPTTVPRRTIRARAAHGSTPLPATTATRYAQSIPFYTINGGEASWLDARRLYLSSKSKKSIIIMSSAFLNSRRDP